MQHFNNNYISSDVLTDIIDGWRMLIVNYMRKGWDAYLVSFLFHEIAGSKEAKKIQMYKEVERVHNRLGTRMVRKTWSPRHAVNLPIGIFLADFPVPKRRTGKKSTIEDVTINDGLHVGGIILANKRGRVRESLEKHFDHEKEVYETGKIRSIGIRQITHDVDKSVDYTFKSLKRRTCTSDDVLVLDWGRSVKLGPELRRWKECCDYLRSARGARLRQMVQAKLVTAHKGDVVTSAK
jgi:hypothetical protein